ncbi:hypothetical protein [Methanolobus psychrotolerans]|uniref:hypothetical protein n=1 Tax=Methanolobus psychrotolerans TaxID=1874706 RepID=UPI0013EC6CB0|nr:hypothetical protein [Methanolobus psychrotolerans]
MKTLVVLCGLQRVARRIRRSKNTIIKIDNLEKVIDEDIQELKGKLDELYNSE